MGQSMDSEVNERQTEHWAENWQAMYLIKKQKLAFTEHKNNDRETEMK